MDAYTSYYFSDEIKDATIHTEWSLFKYLKRTVNIYKMPERIHLYRNIRRLGIRV
jgi:hypothetical protein